jgi:hypothetical protein
MQDDIFPVNPLEDKFLVGSISIYTLSQRIIEVFELYLHMVYLRNGKLTKM